MENSMIKKATNKNLINYEVLNLFDYADLPHRNIDDYPFGGGTGGCTPEPSANGSTNKGGGGGARCDNSPYPKQNGGGGSGVVVIRYKYQN